MGKNVGLLGNVRGKIGNVVFYTSGGLQCSRVHQPVVANPQTKGQRDQRLKMNLVGRISQAIPAIVIQSLQGNSARARRSRFNSSLLRATAIDATSGTDTAVLSMAGIQFSDGTYQPTIGATAYSELVPSTDGTSLKAQVSVEGLVGAGEQINEDEVCRVIMVVIEGSGVSTRVRSTYVDVPATSMTAKWLTVHGLISASTASAFFYCYSMAPISASQSFQYGGVYADNDAAVCQLSSGESFRGVYSGTMVVPEGE